MKTSEYKKLRRRMRDDLESGRREHADERAVADALYVAESTSRFGGDPEEEFAMWQRDRANIARETDRGLARSFAAGERAKRRAKKKTQAIVGLGTLALLGLGIFMLARKQ